ncbi:MAG: hypothetical protein VYE58_02780 [Pseudomonadota bacterium]|nr:hypothetical protein [Pseudomonadota bacterium]
MSELSESQPDGGIASDRSDDEDLADLLDTLDKDSFISVAALHTVAEILTYPHGKDAALTEAENAS